MLESQLNQYPLNFNMFPSFGFLLVFVVLFELWLVIMSDRISVIGPIREVLIRLFD